MLRLRANSSSLLVMAAFMLLLLAYGAAPAQSGRRLPKGSAPPVPQATPQEQTRQTKTPAQPQISLLIMGNIEQSVHLLVPLPDRVLSWVTKRLRDAPALSPMEGDRANRSEAIKRAKATKDGFIIYLKVDETGYSPMIPGTRRLSWDNVSISYSVLAPDSGKALSSGVVYLGQVKSMGRVGNLPLCYPGVRGNDLLLLQASLEVAERIMSALNVPAPPDCRPGRAF